MMTNTNNMRTRQSCTCQNCVNDCKYRPGWFLPGEAEKVAEFLGMNLQELFNTKLGVDYWVGTPRGPILSNILLLAPATATMTPGTMYGFSPIGQCVFLKKDRCLIHPVKPYECKMAFHEHVEGEPNRHLEVAHAWDKPEHQSAIERLFNGRPNNINVFAFENL